MAAEVLKHKVKALLTHEFSGALDDVRVFDGYGDNVHVLVASPKFKDTPEYMRDDRVWRVLTDGLPAAEKALVSLILTFDIDEPEYRWALNEREQGELR